MWGAGVTEAITVEIDEDLSLSIFTVAGDVLVAEIVEFILGHFPESRTDNSLWDLTRADLSVLTKDGIVRIAEAGRTVAPYRKADGRTAIVVTSDMERVLLTIFKAIGDLHGSSRAFAFFDNRTDAVAWIGEGAR